MSQLYVNDPSAKVGLKDGRVYVLYKDGLERFIPVESLDGISIFGSVSISSQCVGECLRRGIVIQYYSSKGAYFGKLISTQNVNVARQRMQAKLSGETEFGNILGSAKY